MPTTLPTSCSPEEDQTNDAASSRTASPPLYQRAVPQRRIKPMTLHQAGQRATTLPMSSSPEENQTNDAASSRTASPPLYQRAVPQRRIKPMTLHQAGQPAHHSTNEPLRPHTTSEQYSHFAGRFLWCCWGCEGRREHGGV